MFNPLAVTVARIILTLAFVAVLYRRASADLVPGAYFSDRMVLQRDQPIPVWGWANAGSDVYVQLGHRTSNCTADAQGRWRVELDPLPAGGPHTLVISADRERVELQDVLIGDVWLCSGQSNMQMTVKEAEGGTAAAERAAQYERLRLLTVPKWASDEPSTKLDGEWKQATVESARDFSAVGCFFALDLLESESAAGVPLGLIDSSFGGTAIEGWIPADDLDGVLAERDISASMFGIKSSALYNAMIHPLTGARIAGVIWYQGEANAGKPAVYARLLPLLVSSWRAAFDNDELPFLIVQLPDYTGTMGGHYFTWLREAQAKAAAGDPHVHLVPTLGSNDGHDLHPKEKQIIGERAAMLARQHAYGEDLIADPPTIADVSTNQDALRVQFDTAGSTLVNASPDGRIRGFELAGEDGQFWFAEATLEGDAVVLRAAQVSQPTHVRYGWSAVGHADLTNKAGMPVAPLRTDEQPVANVEVLKVPTVRQVRTDAYAVTISGLGKVTSLAVDGKQFLDSDVGADGGTSIPGLFGERELRNVRPLSARRIAYADDGARLTFEFDESAMQWTLEATGGDDLEFRIHIDPRVDVHRLSDSRVRLTRGNAAVEIDGVGDVEDRDDSKTLMVRVPKGGTATLLFTISR